MTVQYFRRFLKIFIPLILYLLPLAMALRSILTGTIPFWFDPARDLLQALTHLGHPTLIGPPTGIPGLFYGPYWIWLLSLGLSITRDPRFAVFLVLTLPYFTLFPLVLFSFRRFFKPSILYPLWFLFIVTHINYATHPWNPHPAPLFFITLVYFITLPTKPWRTLLCGLLAGLVLNFHMSFGIGIFFACLLYFTITHLSPLRLKSLILHISLFASGVFVTYIPFFLFELRHQFLQIKTLTHLLEQTFIYHQPVVGVTGLAKVQIIKLFFTKPSVLLNLPLNFSYSLYLFLAVYFFIRFRHHRFHLPTRHRRLLLFLVTSSISLLFIYLTSKNPVWDYHFLGVEIIFLLFMGIAATKLPLVKPLLTFWAAVIFLLTSATFFKSFSQDPLKVPSLAAKKHQVDFVYQQSQNTSFAYYAYSPAIYTYDYDYLFLWLGKEKYHHQPVDFSLTDTTYLIIPPSSQASTLDFIEYRTPKKDFHTKEQWSFPDGTTVYQRTKNSTLPGKNP
jgi:hypothetical protein